LPIQISEGVFARLTQVDFSSAFWGADSVRPHIRELRIEVSTTGNWISFNRKLLGWHSHHHSLTPRIVSGGSLYFSENSKYSDEVDVVVRAEVQFKSSMPESSE